MRNVIFFCFSILLTNLAFAITPVNPPTKVSLVADSETVVPGSTLRIGVHFEIDPEWHIYYKEAQGTGLPTKIELALPDGFTTAGISWPTPVEFKLSDDLFGKGYIKEAFMIAPINIPHDLPEGGPVTFKAMVNWLNCSAKLCMPAKKTLELTLRIDNAKKPDQNDLFAAWENKVS